MYLHNSEPIFPCDKNLFWKIWPLKMFLLSAAKFVFHLRLHFISFFCCARIVNWRGNMPEFHPFVWVLFWLQCVELLCHHIKPKERKKSERMLLKECDLAITLQTTHRPYSEPSSWRSGLAEKVSCTKNIPFPLWKFSVFALIADCG